MSLTLESMLRGLTPAPTEIRVPPGTELLRQGERLGVLFVLVSGRVEIVKNGASLCVVADRGAVFGELSLLLHCYQNATVRAVEACTLLRVDDVEQALTQRPELALELARLLARRLALLDARFAELKEQVARIQAESLQSGGPPF
ncbi:cyclic nucleotide-binding domain-containing protein [Fontisphaera persica]|uniref:cyclic nucleotide-binding domain-containing protein n=1 Tax=Fontisphaera persica TaxID=2974023 RepID=UPI0024BFE54E|nr:cyclic nucleotide-binding domain-containing protein [Fontisphaera persica]WCJ58540.1 cyclic nucleotide-binding domain-containing protein [Fontisphaera persica]